MAIMSHPWVNRIKTTALLGLLTGLLIGIGAWIGGSNGLLIGLIIAGVMNIGSYWFSDKLVLAMYRAKEAKKEDFSKLHSMVEELAIGAGLPKPKLYVINTPQANAFATGRNPQHSAVACTMGILNLLNDDELKGVLAHELAHIKNRDILISSIAATIAGVIGYVAMIARWSAIFGGFGGERDRGNIVELLVLAIVTPIIATIIQLAISRSREYLADATGAGLTKRPAALASALEKISANVQRHPFRHHGSTNATAHLFISNPFRGKSLMKLFSTHPPTNERVRRLHEMKF